MRHPWLGPAVLTGALSPLAVLAVRAAQGRLSADPIAYVLNQLGLLALVFLVASLACTPLRVLFHWSWPVTLRRMLGLLAFAYALLHGLFYVVVDQRLALGVLVSDLLERPFILAGVAALGLLVPLALTSRADSIRRLGAKRWKRLHTLAYLAAVLAVLHFFLRVKADVTEPVLYAAVLTLLFGVRLLEAWRRRAVRRPSAD